MKNYKDSDYAINKYSKGIVYRFTDGNIEVTLNAYLDENPDKTEKDFYELKELSDLIYLEQDRKNNNTTRKDVPLYENLTVLPESVPEITPQLGIAVQALAKLTVIQRRRYLLYHVNGFSTHEIAKKEEVRQRSVMDSLEWADKKIKKYLHANKK